MGITYEDACRLGLGQEHPDHPARRQDQPPPMKVRLPRTNALGQNKTEARFDALLAGLKASRKITWFGFESVKVRLSGRTTYAPDFLVQRCDGSLVFIEVKGYMREDASVKLKTAPTIHPWAEFLVAFADGRGFDIRRVTARGGIDRRPVVDWWRTDQSMPEISR